MTDIDWNVELRRIEREFDGLPPEPSAAAQRARKAAAQRQQEEAEARLAGIGAVARLVLVASLAGALWWWPYGTRCGQELAGFIGAQAMIVVGGLAAAVHCWRHRLAIAHSLALLLVLGGVALVSAQVLPRLGYATVVGVEATAWRCAGTAAPAAPSPASPTVDAAT